MQLGEKNGGIYHRLIRLFPKGTDLNTITKDQIAYVEDWINNRPMKILNYMTPKQKLQHFGVAIASWIHLYIFC